VCLLGDENCSKTAIGKQTCKQAKHNAGKTRPPFFEIARLIKLVFNRPIYIRVTNLAKKNKKKEIGAIVSTKGGLLNHDNVWD
jgi:hypothetical protein